MKLFTDGSVNPQAQIGYGSYLVVDDIDTSLDLLQRDIKTKRFIETSSTKLELQTLLWALQEIQPLKKHITIYTDSQNTMGLLNRRERFEKNDYLTSKGKLIANHELYKEFYRLTDTLDCSFVKVKGHKHSSEKDIIDKIFTLVDRGSREALKTLK
ncbi:MAG: RNase H family protein [Sulfurimonas sp.]